MLKPGKYKGTHSIFSLLKQTWAHMYGTQTISGTEVYVVLGNTVQLSEISPIHFSHLFIIETTTSVHRDMYFYHSTCSTELQLLICTVGRHQWMPNFWLQVSHFSHLSPLSTSRMNVTLQSLHHHLWKWNGVKSGKVTSLLSVFGDFPSSFPSSLFLLPYYSSPKHWLGRNCLNP